MIEGGYAFPVANIKAAEPSTIEEGIAMARGMPLRDHIAIKAMKGILGVRWPDANDRQEISTRAYLMADAMLKARKS